MQLKAWVQSVSNVAFDTSNLVTLKKWFEAHSKLSTNDQAQIAHVSAGTIRKYKRKLDLTTPKKGKPKCVNVNTPSIPAFDIPENWREDREWMTRIVKQYNISQLAKAVNRDRTTIRDLLRRKKIKTKNLKEAAKSKHKCCTHEWCYTHYMVRGFGSKKCAKLAGVAIQTFVEWLNRFGIAVRSRQHQTRTYITIWEKILLSKLSCEKIVRKVYPREGYIHVRFKNFFWENYYTVERPQKRPYTFFELTEENSKLEKVPIVYQEYGTNLEGHALHPAHIALSRTDLNNASLIERRLAIHEYARQIITRGWIQPTFPDDIIAADLEEMRNSNLSLYEENGGFTVIPRQTAQTPGRKLMLHFFDTSAFWKILKRPRLTIKYLNALEKKTVKFNLYHLLSTISANEVSIVKSAKRVALHDAMAYFTMFKSMNLQGTLLDINVGMGNRAVAAIAAGLNYTAFDPKFDHALKNGFGEFAETTCTPYTGQDVDIVLYDEGFKQPDMTKVLPYINKTKKLLVFCPHLHAKEVLKHNPKTAIRLRTSLYRRTPDYIFVW